MANTEVIAKTIGAVAEVVGHELSPIALKLMMRDLMRYPEDQVIAALHRCARECRHRLTLADIIDRLSDGRPGVEEAWAMVPRSEAESVVMTDEMAAALGVAQPLLDEGDPIAARMAFKETYQRQVQKARDEGVAVHWFPSLGHDKAGREQAVIEAVELGRLTHDHARTLISDERVPANLQALVSDIASKKRLSSDERDAKRADVSPKIAAMRDALKSQPTEEAC